MTKAFSEEHLPDPVDEDSCGEFTDPALRRGRDEPRGEFEAVRAALRFQLAQKCRNRRQNDLP